MTTNLQWPELLVVVRHAETERNLRKGYSLVFPSAEAREPIRGIADHRMPLAPQGWEAARGAGLQLRGRFPHLDVAWHSRFERTRQTLDAILEAWPGEERASIARRGSWLIREKEAGYMYEMTQDELETTYPWFTDYTKVSGSFFLRPVGGENMAQVADRVYAFLQMLREECAGKRVLVVTHGDVVRAFRFVLEEWEYDQTMEWWPRNCGAVVYAPERETGRLRFLEEIVPVEDSSAPGGRM